MRIDILTLFPEMFEGVFGESMIKRAREKGIVQINIRNIRDWTDDNHRTADDRSYGGGPGMVMKVEPVDRGITELKESSKEGSAPVVVLIDPQGQSFQQARAKALSRIEHIILICGHYEGFDERIRSLVDLEISIGDYILTCGELPAMVICDSIIRLIPGVLGAEDGLRDESFEDDLLEYPQYTRPANYKGMRVPEVLLSGDHKKIDEWRREQALARTRERRPDLFRKKEENGE